MTPVIRLPCVAGGGCNFLTLELEYWQSKELLDAHLLYAHPLAAISSDYNEQGTVMKETCESCLSLRTTDSRDRSPSTDKNGKVDNPKINSSDKTSKGNSSDKKAKRNHNYGKAGWKNC